MVDLVLRFFVFFVYSTLSACHLHGLFLQYTRSSVTSFAVYADVLELAVLGHVDVVIFAHDLVAADKSKLLKASCELSTLPFRVVLHFSSLSFQSFSFSPTAAAAVLLLLLCGY